MARIIKCPHLDNIIQLSLSELSKLKQNKPCSQCDTNGPNLWICLQKNCLHIGCSELSNDHSTTHFKSNHKHCVHMNLSSQRIWCYLCESEVFLNSTHRRNSIISSDSSETTSRYSNTEKLIMYDKGGGGESCDSSGPDDDEADRSHLNGLVGLQNIANTCYMNAALQALSNSPPLTGYFLDCGAILEANNDLMCNQSNRSKPGIAKSYHRLIREMWCKNRRNNGYVVPSGILYGIRIVHPMFRGFQQHDTQEFLRCFMDQLHEELKEMTPPPPELPFSNDDNTSPCSSPSPSQSEAEYETCDSGVSEQSSLSDDNISINHKRTRNKSRSPSPTQNQRNINNNANNNVKLQSSMVNNRNNSNSSLNTISTTNPMGSITSQQNQKISTSSVASSSNSQESSSNKSTSSKHPHRSIISDIFDGKLLSSVQCLTCDRISTREETFQDLSLPIPGKDHLAVLHQNQSMPNLATFQTSATCSDAVYQATQDGWMLWFWNWFRSLFWGPAVSLHDCLAAFFSADELKGDNMYSCEKCNKLRNGVKYSRVMALPEILCVHLKRFRHDLSYSSKISSPVLFPLTGLEMRPYLHKDCNSEVSSYDLCAIICHHGTVGSGHYTSFAKHEPSGKWFEYDDQLVTQVTPEVVQNCEAYVLFYRKNNPLMALIRSQALELVDCNPPQASDIRFYVSRQWLNRFNTFAEPGPIDNWALLCPHGGLSPCKAVNATRLVVPLPQPLWDFLYKKFGGGPACNHLFICDLCRRAAESLSRRQKNELEQFTTYNDEFQYQDSPTTIYAISMAWFRQWQLFARGTTNDEPGPIDNNSIAPSSSNVMPIRNVRPGSDYAQINSTLWKFFYDIYGGGPEIILRGGGTDVTSSQRNNSGSYSSATEDNSKANKGGNTNATTPIITDKNDIDYILKLLDEHESQVTSNISIKESSSNIIPTTTNSESLSPQINVAVKTVKSVSFEDSEFIPQNEVSNSAEAKAINNTSIIKSSPPIVPVEIGGKRERKQRSGIKSNGLFGAEGKYSDLKYTANSDSNLNSSVSSSTNSSNLVQTMPSPANNNNNNENQNEIDETKPLLNTNINIPIINSTSADVLDNEDPDDVPDSKLNQSHHNHRHHHGHGRKSSKHSDNHNSNNNNNNGYATKQYNRKKLKTKYPTKKVTTSTITQTQHSIGDTNSDSEK